MKPGYNASLYLLPFDHRQSYVAGMFRFQPPLTPAERDTVASSKQIIYDGFQEAVDNGVPASCAGILVDEEFGAGILHDARKNGYVTALPVEKSGPGEFEFEYGEAFAEHIEAFRPTFAKVLVRYNPADDAALNLRQTARLRRLSDYCRHAGQRFMFELLVPATEAQMRQAGMDKDAYDRHTRPALMRQAIRALQDAGVEPDVWKIEGLDGRGDYEQLVETARRDARDDVGCIVLGRGAGEARVVAWLETAAPVPGMIGFAVGRTTFWDAIAGYESGEINGREAVSRIARNYARWVARFEQARASHHAAALPAAGSTAPDKSDKPS
ncbi:2-deoxy-5-keto-D-gluconate 6-phosphate aldolase domain-containing protein [Cupriavidus sp. 30B13]|uniref:2-deoxy-5-keto-D-gluconate 6-phosphate aldolase domain-containing protein n=1 Tax=Cupriavidus sp. 30B13 TaxID=3384241 RepID=UPI003B917971